MPLLASRVDASVEDLSQDILTDRLSAELGAPALAKPKRWWDLIGTIRDSTDESPESARGRTRMARARRITLMRQDANGLCRRGHHLEGANVYVGKNGSQCRQCRNETRRNKRARAA